MNSPAPRSPPAPGSRIRVRGEEWAVLRTEALFDGHAVHVQGLSELVRHHRAIFLTRLDPEMEELTAEATKLVPDESPHYRQTTLYLETLLKRMPPTHDRIALGHRGALEPMNYQLVPAQMGLSALRPRLLIADGTGLGKTVEIGILLTELAKRGRARRVLVVAIRSMLAQLQRELWARFTLPLVRLDSEGLVRVQAKIPANRNPFSYFDRCIVSMDTLKNNGLYRTWLEQIRWDVIVVDECHNVANRGSQRAELADLLAKKCDALILTSATPHNGRAESFGSLMRMLDPTSVADPQNFTKEDVGHLFVRRFKRDVQTEARDQLQERNTRTLTAEATAEEEVALRTVHELALHGFGRRALRRDALVGWTLVKALLSSPEAALESLTHRRDQTERVISTQGLHPFATALQTDLSALDAAIHAVRQVAGAKSSKLGALIAALREVGLTNPNSSPRVVIFSERIATLEMLQAELSGVFKLKANQVALYTAATATNEVDQRALIESFGHADSPLRLLLCSDAASEGVNLHHQCHHLFHYDVPWSIIRLTQRNGRIDRFGQRHVPHLVYVTCAGRDTTADRRVIERLIAKEREVERQLGDPGALLGLYDADREEQAVLRAVARGDVAEQIIPDVPRLPAQAERELASADDDAALLEDDGESPSPAHASDVDDTETDSDSDGVDLLALLAEVSREHAKSPDLHALTKEEPTLYANDFAFLVAALVHLEKDPAVGREPLKFNVDDASQSVEILAPEAFTRHREPFLPREAVPARGEPYRLVGSRDTAAASLRAALDQEGRWPVWHLLWEAHPLVEWLLDTLSAAYARGEAPILRVPTIGKGRAIFLLQALMFNHEAEAVFAEWLGVEVHDGNLVAGSLPLGEVFQRANVAPNMVNSGKKSTAVAQLERLLPAVVQEATRRAEQMRREQLSANVRRQVREATRRLERWVERSMASIERRRQVWLAKGRGLPPHVEQRLRLAERSVQDVRVNHETLLKSVSAEGKPYLRVVAVFSGE